MAHCEIINVCYKCVIKMSKCVTKIEKLKILNDLNDLDLNDRILGGLKMIMTLNDFDPS